MAILNQPIAGAVTQGGTWTVNIPFAMRVDTHSSTGSGTAVDASATPFSRFSIQVKATGVVTAWDVRLEGSLDNTNFTQILQHTNIIGDAAVVFGGAAAAPCLYFRSRLASITLGSGTNVVVTILGVQ